MATRPTNLELTPNSGVDRSATISNYRGDTGRNERWIDSERCMVFYTDLDGRRVQCSISEATLDECFAGEASGHFAAFRDNFAQIESAARKKAQAVQHPPETLVLTPEDFANEDDSLHWLKRISDR